MSVFTAIAVYAVIWWIVLFAILPWGVKIPENPEKGHATSAPENPQLLKKFIWTSVVAAVIWLGYFLVNRYGLISFR